MVRVAASLREKAKKKTKQTEACDAAGRCHLRLLGHTQQYQLIAWLLGRDPKAWRDPFEPHEEALFVQDLGPDHKLLLNKFNVVAHHCLVVTKSGRCAMLH